MPRLMLIYGIFRKFTLIKHSKSEEQSYSNIITDAVDRVFEDDMPISENEMCKALEFAEANNIFVKIVPDEGHTTEYNCPVHIEFVGSCSSATVFS